VGTKSGTVVLTAVEKRSWDGTLPGLQQRVYDVLVR